jgi:flagellar basal-body rod modification protein FlgD
MATSPIAGSSAANSATQPTAAVTNPSAASQVGTLPPSSQLNESDFLTLLSTELQYQDPSNPVDDTQFISELAQFSSLSAANQQQQTLTQILSQLSNGSGSDALLSAAQLIGKTVSTQSLGSGTVAGVTLGQNGAVQVELANGRTLALSDLTGVQNG